MEPFKGYDMQHPNKAFGEHILFLKAYYPKQVKAIQLLKVHRDCKGLLSQVFGDLRDPSSNGKIFTNVRALNELFLLLPVLSPEEQLDSLDRVIILLEESLWNCHLCSSESLIEKIVSILKNREDFSFSLGIIHKLIFLIGILGSHSINSRELRALFRLMKNQNDLLDQDLAPLIIETLIKMTRTESPSSFFNFNGRNGGLIVDQFDFPTSGYTFSTWIRLESVQNNEVSRLFSFLDHKKAGVEVLFRGNQCNVYVVSGKKRLRLQCPQFFHTHRWYYLTVTQSKKHFFYNSEVCIYVNGKLTKKSEMKYPPISSRVSFAHIGTGISSNIKVLPLYGQCSAIAFFDRALSDLDILNMYKCGPDFQYQFKKGDFNGDISWTNSENLASKLYLLYNPRASTVEGYCIDNAIRDKTKTMSLAQMQPNTQVVLCQKVSDTLHCIGGIEDIYPLIEWMKKLDWTIDFALCARIISLIAHMVAKSKDHQSQLHRNGGEILATLGYLLSRCPPSHLDENTVKSLVSLQDSVFFDKDLTTSRIIQHLFLNMDIWIQTSFSIQQKVLYFIFSQVKQNSKFFFSSFGIRSFLHILRKYYYFNVEPKISDKKLSRSDMSNSEIYSLRKVIKDIIASLLTFEVTVEDIRSILVYILDCEDIPQKVDMIQFLFVLLDEELPNLAQVVYQVMFPNLFHIFYTDSRTLKLYALKLIGKTLAANSPDQYKKFVSKGNLLAIQHYLSRNSFDMKTYSVVMEIVLNNINPKPLSEPPNLKATIVYAEFLIPLFHIIYEQPDEMQIRFIQNFKELMKVNQSNRSAIAEIQDWQYLLLKLIGQPTSENSDLSKELKSLSHNNGESFDKRKTIMNIICGILNDEMRKGESTGIYQTIKFIEYFGANSSNGTNELYVLFFQELLPFLAHNISNTSIHIGEPFWETVYNVAAYVEQFIDTPISENSIDLQLCILEIAEKFLKSCDVLIKKSGKEMKVMEVLHYNFSKKKTFSLKTILDFAQDITGAGKSILPDQTLFRSLYRMGLFALEQSDEKRAFDQNHLIRLLGLLAMDINIDYVPPIEWTGEVTDQEQNQKRMYYVLATLFHGINEGKVNLVTPLKGVLLKYKDTLASTLTSVEARNFLSQPTGFQYLSKNSNSSQFISHVKSEWYVVLDSEPLSSYLTNIIKKQAENPEVIQKRRQKYQENVSKMLAKHESKTKSSQDQLIQEISQKSQKLTYDEFQTFVNLNNSRKRQRTITGNEWRERRKDLFSAVGLWHVSSKGKQKFEILDLCENSVRMRLRLVENIEGTDHKDASVYSKKKKKDTKDDDSLSSEVTSSIFQSQKDPMAISSSDDEAENENDLDSSVRKELKESGWVDVQAEQESALKCEEVILNSFHDVELILPLQVVKGSIDITEKFIYFSVDKSQTENPENEICEDMTKYEKKWKIFDILQLFKRRYLLQFTAIELFLKNKTAVMLNFPKDDVSSFYKELLKSNSLKSLENDAFKYSPSALLKRSKLTQKWQRREISNFEYLMALNTFANRTMNDLTQYPVFPWVLQDYVSEQIDLGDPSVYRDLSRPIGALNPQRLEEIMERYNTFDDPMVPKFHYGSHYSSCGVVLYFLLRLEPFTTWNIKLQGGYFDLPDRLFHSLPSTWDTVMTSTSDVKELIPEFYYQPEMFKNKLGLDLGIKQDEEKLGDVKLPPWAKSPEEFIRIHRDALESEFVSSHLHEWIDLIFGYKQRGPEAVKAANVFYYLTYEGSVNLENIDDPIMKRSIITQMSNFGQTPSQLLRSKHPKRLPRASVQRPSHHLNANQNHMPFFSFLVVEDSKQLLHLKFVNSKLLTINIRRELSIYGWMKSKPSTIMATPIGSTLAKDLMITSSCFAIAGDRWIFSVGHFDKSIKATAIFDKMIVKQSLFTHKDIVSCLSIDEQYLVSGSKDGSVNLFIVRKESNRMPLSTPITLYGHLSSINSVDLNVDNDTIVSADRNGIVLLHSISGSGKYLRKIKHPNNKPINIVKITKDGVIIIHSLHDCSLHCFTINGTLLSSANINDRLNDISISSDGKYIFTGGYNRTLVVRRIHDLAEIKRYGILPSNIRCITSKDSNNIIVGTDLGVAYIFGFVQNQDDDDSTNYYP